MMGSSKNQVRPVPGPGWIREFSHGLLSRFSQSRCFLPKHLRAPQSPAAAQPAGRGPGKLCPQLQHPRAGSFSPLNSQPTRRKASGLRDSGGGRGGGRDGSHPGAAPRRPRPPRARSPSPRDPGGRPEGHPCHLLLPHPPPPPRTPQKEGRDAPRGGPAAAAATSWLPRRRALAAGRAPLALACLGLVFF